MNLTISGRSAQNSSRRVRRLRDVVLTSFEPGQLVVWRYRSQVPPYEFYLVVAEVVYGGPLRVRIRLQDTAGNILLRWVTPERLRLKQANDIVQLYPAQTRSE
jgi:hypothetical protein